MNGDEEEEQEWDAAAAAALATAGIADQLEKFERRDSLEPETAPSLDGEDLPDAPMGKARRAWLLPRNAQTRESLVVPLRSSDCMYVRSPLVTNGYVFDYELEAGPLQTGLQEAIDIFPVAAGRLRKYSGPRPYRIALPRSRGVPFTVRRRKGDAPESDANPGLRSWRRFARWSKDELLETTSADPMLRVELFLLPDTHKSVLVITFSHLFGDGAAMVHFMNTWSHLACVAAGVTPMPAELPPPPVLDRQPAYDAAELERVHKAGPESFPEGRLPALATAKFLGTVLVARTRSRIVDFSLDLSDVARMKDAVSAELAPGQWVSSYEVMMAMLLKAQGVADGVGNKDITTRALVNTRGRGELDPLFYVGNALAYVPLDIPATAHADKDRWLSATALYIHDTLRGHLKDKALLDRLHYVFEDGVTRRGAMKTILHRLSWLKPWARNVLEQQSVCNSWLGYNYFDMTFGGTRAPVLFRVPKSFSQRGMLFIGPRTRTEVLVRIHVSTARAAKFDAAIAELGIPLRKLPEGGPGEAAAKNGGDDNESALAAPQE